MKFFVTAFVTVFVATFNVVRVASGFPQKLLQNIILFGVIVLASMSANALTLQETIKDTLENNPDIQSVRQEMLSREHQVREAKAGYLPTLDAAAGVGREWTRSPSTSNTDVILTREEVSLELKQVIYDGNRTGSEVDRQKSRYESAIHAAVETQENVALSASEAYLNVMRQAELLSLLKVALDEHQKIYDQMSLRNQAGVGSRADVDQIAGRLSLAHSNFIAGKNNFVDSLSQFHGVVGYIPNASKLKLPAEMLLPSSLDESLQMAFDDHPTIKVAQANITSAEARHASSKASYMPTLNLEGGRSWNEDIDGTSGPNEDWVLALRLRYNLYNGGKDSARRSYSADQLQKAKEAYRDIRWQIEEGLRLSWYAYESSLQRLDHLSSYVKSVGNTKEAYIKQFDLGRRTLLDLLNTENEWSQAQQSYTNAKYDQAYSRLRVANAIGQLTHLLGIK